MKTLKGLFILLLILTATVTSFAQSSKGKMPDSKSDTTAKYVYTCTMHPEVISDKAGKCPKCGMDLVKKKVDKIYTCTMHPDVVSDKPGKCPKCGMDLVEKKSIPKMNDKMK
ncbi:MAG TPA: heavy metal-binding domain-containing protein [Puia sp.]|nr:heavy metal-binding domain-containing protein [Puia sp.]